MSDDLSTTSAESLVDESEDDNEEAPVPIPSSLVYNNPPPFADDALANSVVQDHLLQYTSLTDIIALWSTSSGSSSVRLAAEEVADSPIPRASQFSPRSYVKLFLVLMRHDFRVESLDRNNGVLFTNRIQWEFDDWVGGTLDERFDLRVPLPERDRQLYRLFKCTFCFSPSMCFELYRSLLKNGFAVHEPKHILWACLKCNLGLHQSWELTRMAEFVMAEITIFNDVTSSLFDEVASCFGNTFTGREFLPNELFFPYHIEKSVFYLCNDSTGYEYEIVMHIPVFYTLWSLDCEPGYILQVAVRQNMNFRGQSKSQRQLDFYEHSLKMRRQQDEAIVMPGFPDEDDDTILAEGDVQAYGNARLFEALQKTGVHVEAIKTKMMNHVSHLVWASSHEQDEDILLKQLKFVAYMINLEMSLDL